MNFGDQFGLNDDGPAPTPTDVVRLCRAILDAHATFLRLSDEWLGDADAAPQSLQEALDAAMLQRKALLGELCVAPSFTADDTWRKRDLLLTVLQDGESPDNHNLGELAICVLRETCDIPSLAADGRDAGQLPGTRRIQRGWLSRRLRMFF